MRTQAKDQNKSSAGEETRSQSSSTSAEALIPRGCTHHTAFPPLVRWLWPRVSGGWEMLLLGAGTTKARRGGCREKRCPTAGRGTRLRELKAGELKARRKQERVEAHEEGCC